MPLYSFESPLSRYETSYVYDVQKNEPCRIFPYVNSPFLLFIRGRNLKLKNLYLFLPTNERFFFYLGNNRSSSSGKWKAQEYDWMRVYNMA